jgi:hypothetical protein
LLLRRDQNDFVGNAFLQEPASTACSYVV